jgi:hypothetical protein
VINRRHFVGALALSLCGLRLPRGLFPSPEPKALSRFGFLTNDACALYRSLGFRAAAPRHSSWQVDPTAPWYVWVHLDYPGGACSVRVDRTMTLDDFRAVLVRIRA